MVIRVFEWRLGFVAAARVCVALVISYRSHLDLLSLLEVIRLHFKPFWAYLQVLVILEGLGFELGFEALPWPSLALVGHTSFGGRAQKTPL